MTAFYRYGGHKHTVRARSLEELADRVQYELTCGGWYAANDAEIIIISGDFFQLHATFTGGETHGDYFAEVRFSVEIPAKYTDGVTRVDNLTRQQVGTVRLINYLRSIVAYENAGAAVRQEEEEEEEQEQEESGGTQ